MARTTKNVPRGLYRNTLDAELHVTQTVMLDRLAPFKVLAGDIAIAEARDDLFGTSYYLVTEASLKDCGYELVEPAAD